MTDRQTKVTLSLRHQEYVAGMRESATATRQLAMEGDKLALQRQHFDMLGRTAVAAGGLIAVGLGVAVAKFAEFDQAMSAVQAATHESEENMLLLKDAAIEAGARTVYSAKEAANAIEELAKAGISTKDILAGGLNGALDLAAAGGLGVADAAGIAATALKQFKLNGDQASHVADLLAAGAGKAMGDVTDLSQALNQGGLVANQFGLTIEETVGTLAAFASNGLLGSDAGTSFKTMLQRLVPQSKQAQQTMDALGLSAFDSSGNFIGMAEYAGKLHDALYDMDDQQKNTTLSVLFGSDAVRAASVIMDEGADGIQKWIDKSNDQAYAAETAALRLDNLKGDIEKFQGAVDSAAISMGEAADGPLRFLVQTGTDLIDLFNDLPAGAKQATFGVGAVTSAVLLGYGAYLLAIPKIAAYNAALATMGTNAQRAGRLLAAVGKGAGITAAIAVTITAASNALVAYAREMRGTDEAVNKATTTNQSFLKSMDELNKTTGTTTESIRGAINAIARGDVFGSVGLDILTLRDGLTELGKGLTDIPLDTAVTKFQSWTKELGLSRAQIQTLLGEEGLKGFRDAIATQLKSTDQAASKQDVLNYAMGKSRKASGAAADSFQEQADKIKGVQDALRDLTDTINADNDAQKRAISAKADYAEGLAQLKGQVKEYGDSLDMSERKGLNNAAMLGDLATKAQESAQAQYDLDQKTMGASEAAEAYAKNLTDQRKKLEDAAVAAGFSRDEVKKLLDTIFKLPDAKSIKILADTSAASNAIANLIDTFNNKKITLQARIKAGAKDAELMGIAGIGRAAGGPIVGPGTGTSDTAGLYALSNGEHVWTAAEVAAAGGQGAMYAMRSAVRNGSWRAYAGGGAVSAPATAAAPALPPIQFNGPIHVRDVDEMARVVERERRWAYARAGVRV